MGRFTLALLLDLHFDLLDLILLKKRCIRFEPASEPTTVAATLTPMTAFLTFRHGDRGM
jgi:hypothetical protein